MKLTPEGGKILEYSQGKLHIMLMDSLVDIENLSHEIQQESSREVSDWLSLDHLPIPAESIPVANWMEYSERPDWITCPTVWSWEREAS